MGFQCGIVGLPNVGKSTLFNALTTAGVDAENYPFCTVDPNTGVVAVPDQRLNKLQQIVNPKKTIPTQTTFVDIAGLVRGASKGEGLGNRFLAHIRETQAIAHVVRCFKESKVTHVDNHINPIKDIETIDTELCLADLETTEKAAAKLQRMANAGDKEAKLKHQTQQEILTILNTNTPLRRKTLTESQEKECRELGLITIKPVLYAANINEQDIKNTTEWEHKLQQHAQKENAPLIFMSAAIEAEIATLTDQEKQEFYKELGITESGLDKLITAGYNILNLQTFFTAGPKEVRAWTIQKGTTAQKAAAKIHTDIEKGFIRAEVISYNDYITHNGEQAAKQAGKSRLEGKEYPVQDGDIIHIRHSA